MTMPLTNSEIHYPNIDICYRISGCRDESFRSRFGRRNVYGCALRRLLEMTVYNRLNIINVNQYISRLDIYSIFKSRLARYLWLRGEDDQSQTCVNDAARLMEII